MRRLIMSAVVAACLAPLPGSTLQQLSLNDMILKSTAIVYGAAQPSYTAFRGSMIYTHYQVQVINSYKTSLVRYWDVAVPGGVVNGVRQSVAGAPVLTAGQNYLLFLWTSTGGLTQVIGLSQGVFDVTTNSSGQLIVSRGATTETMLNASGQMVTDSNIRMTMGQIVNRIQNVLAGGSGQ